MINLKSYHAYTRATLRLTMRDRVVLFFSYLFPVVFFFAFGEGFDAAKSTGNTAQVLSMVLVLGVLGNGFFGGGIRAVVEREAGILRRFKVAPISAAPILVSSVVTGWVIYMPAVVVFFLLAHLRYSLPVPANPVSLFILLSLGTIAFRSMGLIIASVVNTMGESQVLVQLLYFPMLLLSGATIPLSSMPDWLQVVAQFLPATHFYLGLQGMLMHGESAWDNLSGLA
ncbi:MAG TPA: ABC transporter permease, partial [Bryobacteraceae bacterium]|nr:ABC transporter permease [Bryobacteraceae bacterium]